MYVPAALVLPQLYLASDFPGRNKAVHLMNKIFILFFKLDLFTNQKKKKKKAVAKD